jgi:hypothetical protein
MIFVRTVQMKPAQVIWNLKYSIIMIAKPDLGKNG